MLDGIAAGLDHAHARRVIHRDIKPANLLLDLALTHTPKVSDFGIALPMRSGEHYAPQPSTAGTPAYMSPEHHLGHPLDARADVYALSATVYTLLGGHAPFRSRADQSTSEPPPIPGVSSAVMQVLRSGLAKIPEGRPPTCGELARAFRDAASAPAPCAAVNGDAHPPDDSPTTPA